MGEEIPQALREYKSPRAYGNRNDVLVIYSPGFGAGITSWNSDFLADILLFHRDLVELVQSWPDRHSRPYRDEERYKKPFEEALMRILEEQVGLTDDEVLSIMEGVYLGGVFQATLESVPPGTPFKVKEYDGAESIVAHYDETWRVP